MTNDAQSELSDEVGDADRRDAPAAIHNDERNQCKREQYRRSVFPRGFGSIEENDPSVAQVHRETATDPMCVGRRARGVTSA